jgi:hypothetical protein
MTGDSVKTVQLGLVVDVYKVALWFSGVFVLVKQVFESYSKDNDIKY